MASVSCSRVPTAYLFSCSRRRPSRRLIAAYRAGLDVMMLGHEVQPCQRYRSDPAVVTVGTAQGVLPIGAIAPSTLNRNNTIDTSAAADTSTTVDGKTPRANFSSARSARTAHSQRPLLTTAFRTEATANCSGGATSGFLDASCVTTARPRHMTVASVEAHNHASVSTHDTSATTGRVGVNDRGATQKVQTRRLSSALPRTRACCQIQIEAPRNQMTGRTWQA